MKDSIRIAHLIASGGLYGAEKWIMALMRAMNDKQFESVLVNLSDVRGVDSAVVSVAREKGLEALDFFTGGTFNPFSIIKLAGWLKENKIHILHGHGYKSDLIGLVAARLAGCKMISTPHGWSREADRKLQFYEALDRFLFRFMDYVCPLSDDLFASIQSCVHQEKLQLIINGVDVDEVQKAPKAIGEVNGNFLVGYVGQLIERKNLSTLIKSIKCLADCGDEVILIIVGGGPERERLERLTGKLGLNDKVIFKGYRKDAISLMKSFDVFVLPSLLEGIPRCVMEAMAAGIPVIASDIPGNRSLIEHGETGLLFPPYDEQALANTLMSLFGDGVARKSFSDNARKLVFEKYSNYRMASEYSLVYSRIQSI